MSLKKIFALSTSVLILICSTASAESADGQPENVYKVDTTFVTATMREQNIFEVPADSCIITSEDIHQKNIVTVADAIKELPGVFVEKPKGVADATGKIYMRGFTEYNILVLYDGMPVNAAYNGSVDWSAIPVDNIEKIEAVKGAASSLYGGRAVGGVINIITSGADSDKLKARLTAFYGTHNTWRRGFSAGKKLTDKFGFYISYEDKRTDGFENKVASYTRKGSSAAVHTVGTGLKVSSKTDGKPRYIIGSKGDSGGKIKSFNINLRYDFDRFKNLSYSFTRSKFSYWSENPESCIRDANGNRLFVGSVKLPNGKWLNFDESYFTDYDGRRETDIHALRYSDRANMLYMNLGVTDTKESGYSTGDKFDGNTPGKGISYPSRTVKANIVKTWDISERNALTAGADFQQFEMTRSNSDLLRWNDHDSISRVNFTEGGKNNIYALFAQNEYAFSDKWKVYLGVRYDRYKKYDGYHHEPGNPKKNREYESTSYNEISPKIALEFTPRDDISFYTSYGHSFNPPSIYQLYRSDGKYIANPDLEPETSNTFEIGLKKKFGGRTEMNAAYYHVKTDDLIEIVPYPRDTDKKWYRNVETATSDGVDISLSHRFSPMWSAYASYSWHRTYDERDERIYDSPEHLARGGIVYEYGKWRAAFKAAYASSSDSPQSVSDVYLAHDEHFVSGLEFSYRPSDRCRITFSIDNLFDEEYYLMYKAPGRTFTFGIQLES